MNQEKKIQLFLYHSFFFGTIGFILLLSLIFNIIFSDKFNFDCFEQKAVDYCNSINQNYTNSDYNSPYKFYCEETNFDFRTKRNPDRQFFYYSDGEIENCTTKKSWYVRVVVKGDGK